MSYASFTAPSEGTNKFEETLGIMMCLLAAIVTGLQYTIIRVINQHISYLTKPFFFGIGGTVVCVLPLLGGDSDKLYSFEGVDAVGVLLLCGIGLGFFCGEMFISLALRLDKAGRVSAFKYLEMVVAYIADVAIFGTTVYPTDVSGGVVILCSFLAITVLKLKGYLT